MSVKITKPTSTQPLYPSDQSLYVGNLADNVTVQDLVEIFSQATPVISARVCIDRITHKPRGYGYVSYATPEEAKLALREFNHSDLKGKPIRVMKSFSGLPKEFPLESNLFINNLPKSFTPLNLHDSFEKFGKILSSKISFDHQGNSKGFGYIQFENLNDSNEAMMNSNEFEFDLKDETCSKKLKVTPYLKPEERKSNFTNVFFRNLPLEFDEECFSNYASQFGEITSMILNPIKKSKAKTRTGNVNYKDSNVASRLVEESKTKGPGEIIALRSIKKSNLIKPRLKSEENKENQQTKLNQKPSYSKTTIKVKPIPSHFSEVNLSDSFSKFGQVLSSKIIKSSKHHSKNLFGFVTFEKPEFASNAIQSSILKQDSWSVRPAINNNRRKFKNGIKLN
ncbi:hypothetical protein DFH28DRAFT_942789 [Melampsora americana]|nr:hypothetical protein DFH28DRAFT_942789 [Melampsora americana]